MKTSLNLTLIKTVSTTQLSLCSTRLKTRSAQVWKLMLSVSLPLMCARLTTSGGNLTYSLYDRTSGNIVCNLAEISNQSSQPMTLDSARSQKSQNLIVKSKRVAESHKKTVRHTDIQYFQQKLITHHSYQNHTQILKKIGPWGCQGVARGLLWGC